MHSDDYYYSEDVISHSVSELENGNLDCVYGDVEYFLKNKLGKTIRRYSSKGFNKYKLKFGLMPAHPTMMIKRKIYKKVGNFNPNYRIAGDFEHMCRVFSLQGLRSKYLERVMVRMQIGGLSTSGFASAKIMNAEILQACKKNNIRTNQFLISLRYLRKLPEFIMR